MSQVPVLKAMANNYRNGHSWDHLDGEACIKAAEEITKLQLMLETMTADRDAEKTMKVKAREQRSRVTSKNIKAVELFHEIFAANFTFPCDLEERIDTWLDGSPMPTNPLISRKSDSWSKEWKECGFNYSVDSAIKALRYLANNERPIGGQERYNSEHLFQIAEELMYTKNELLVKA